MYPISPRIHFKMAARVRNADWEDDLELKNDLKEQVSRNLRQLEIVDLMKVKYSIYCWSLRTLSRRLHHFGIRYTDYSVDLEVVSWCCRSPNDVTFSLLSTFTNTHLGKRMQNFCRFVSTDKFTDNF